MQTDVSVGLHEAARVGVAQRVVIGFARISRPPPSSSSNPLHTSMKPATNSAGHPMTTQMWRHGVLRVYALRQQRDGCLPLSWSGRTNPR